MIKIIVDSEELKQKILEESEYIHNYVEYATDPDGDDEIWYCLDSDKAGSLMHLYMCPEIIIVEKSE